MFYLVHRVFIANDDWLDRLSDVEGAKHILEKLQQVLTEVTTSHHWAITLSIGVVTFFTPPACSEDIIGFADKLMYSVKTSGKNNIAFESWSVDNGFN